VNFKRESGILLHPTSLPGEFGIGDLGEQSARFVDFLAASGQALWQVLPLGPTGYGDSPYQCFSAFAGNPLLISPERLVETALLSNADLESLPAFDPERVEYGRVQDFKNALLGKAYENFRKTSNGGLLLDFQEFCKKSATWLDDYALYRALKDAHGGKPWYEWEAELVRREPAQLEVARAKLREEIKAHKFFQYLFFKQWSAVRALCRERGIKVIGDIPIFVAHDSVDVWANPELFKLDKARNPLVVAGVPPDFFSKTGQLWGNPIYDWERMRADGFQWWVRRVRASLEMFDIVRLDHFRGFAAAWEVPAKDKTAEHGKWINAPGRELFTALKESLGELPIMAEDLGVITPDVEALRDEFNFPGMRILQFAFGGDAGNPHLPHNYVRNSVAYTGTHDNDTALGWFLYLNKSAGTDDGSRRAREHCLKYLNSDGKEINWDMIRASLASVADTSVTPLQDVLGLGHEGRMNLPASKGGNWDWRFQEGALTQKLSERLREMSALYGRIAS
jgi:4-alpha-glucanotransferase